MSVVSIATLKTYFQTGDFPTQAQFDDLIDTLDNASISVYKRYLALLTQSLTGAPTAVILENTLGGTVVWTYVNTGRYSGTLASAFTANKSTSILGSTTLSLSTIGFGDVNTISIRTYDIAGAAANDILNSTLIEIRVYP